MVRLYIMSWFNFFSEPKKVELDEFDKRFKFILDMGATKLSTYNELKEIYFRDKAQ